MASATPRPTLVPYIAESDNQQAAGGSAAGSTTPTRVPMSTEMPLYTPRPTLVPATAEAKTMPAVEPLSFWDRLFDFLSSIF